MRNVVLIRLGCSVTGVSPPLGIGYLIKSLEQIEGIQAVFIDCQLEKIKTSELIDRVRSYHPMLIGFQLYSVNYFEFHQLLPVLRQVCPMRPWRPEVRTSPACRNTRLPTIRIWIT